MNKKQITETNKVTSEEQNIQDAIALLRGLLPHERNCPAEEGRRETWSPRFSEKGINILNLNDGISGRCYGQFNIIYVCGFSDFYKCEPCLRGGYYKINKPE